ncbi:MAG: MTH938/NDUFAF3 family protein [Candidatus Competibacter sp.]|nr:MTH938/NDUFAF3 family protein [Candidatus Competibacter sp.]
MMKAQFTTFGEIDIAGQRYDHDVVIDSGKIRKRTKKASKVHRDAYGHTPLSLEENLPWGGRQLIVGTGMYGRLPVMPEVHQEAARRQVELVVVPTEEACRLLADRKDRDVHAVLHVTC